MICVSFLQQESDAEKSDSELVVDVGEVKLGSKPIFQFMIFVLCNKEKEIANYPNGIERNYASGCREWILYYPNAMVLITCSGDGGVFLN